LYISFEINIVIGSIYLCCLYNRLYLFNASGPITT
ncbi:unnamed protein product, partial [Rotaria magnacalcarata]